MRVIQKQVSLEPMTSRLPGLYPAYKDGELYFFNDSHLESRGNEFPTNWGMIPVMLSLNGKPSSSSGCSDYSVVCNGTFKMSWERMSQWYHFFTEYYHLLNDYGHCGMVYDNAVDYYENESRSKYADQLKYGSERETYERMDEMFDEMGGKVNVPSDKCTGKATDKGFYCWLRQNIVQTEETKKSNVNNINNTILAEYDCSTKELNSCFVPTLDDSINLQVSIDDMGEFAIFSKEYNLGENVPNGDVMTIDGKTYTLKPGAQGFLYDEVFKEMVFNEEDWSDYTSSYIEENKDYFSTDFNYYGFREDGTKVTGDSESAVKALLVTWYPAIEKKGVVIDGDIYPIHKDEYVTYNNKKYIMYRENDTQTPYIYFNGKKVYANLNTSNITGICYTFPMTGCTPTSIPRTKATTGLYEYISYNGGNYEVVNNTVTIGDMTYMVVDGYFDSDRGTLYYRGSTVYAWYAMEMQTVTGYTKDGNYFKKTDSNPVVYKSGSVTGITTSKLDALCSTDWLVDDVGNKLPGRYDVGTKKNHQPSEGEELDLLYEVGNYANIRPYSKTLNLNEILQSSATENFFVGDIITGMVFYYMGLDGTKYNSKSWSTSSLSTIQSVARPNEVLKSENIFCDITYCMGATLVREENDVFKLYSSGNYGVRYTETVEFEKTNVEYYLKAENKKSTPMEKNSPGYHSVSYPVVCYVIKKKDTTIDNDTNYTDNLATFEMSSLRYKNGSEVRDDDDNVVPNNGMIVSPVMRQEYMLGSATMQNIDVNIYIDRGINAAIEKHIKLGEVTSMEALENYSNGYFKIMEN